MSAPEPATALQTPRRPYAALLAKGEDRRQRILGVAERLLARNGWRNTSLAQIAREAGALMLVDTDLSSMALSNMLVAVMTCDVFSS